MQTHSGAPMLQETSQKVTSQLPEGLSTTYEDSLLSSRNHCVLLISLNLDFFRIHHKALVLFLVFLLSPWALLMKLLLQFCLLSSFRRCVEVTPANTEELKGVRPQLRHLTSCLNPCKQRNKHASAPFPYVHLLREHRPIKTEPDISVL